MATVRCEGLSKRFGGVQALSEVALEVPAGEVLVIRGPSGSGKTTLLRVVAGLEEPDAGSVAIGGRTVTGDGVLVATPAEDPATFFRSVLVT